MSLKAAQIPAFKPTNTPYRKFDGKGLYLEVRPNGSKLWYFKYRFLGSEKRLSFGTFPEVNLAQARQRCDDARRLIDAGEDPGNDQERLVAEREVLEDALCPAWPVAMLLRARRF